MKKSILVLAGVLALIGLAPAQKRPPTRKLWAFFSESTGDLKSVAQALRAMRSKHPELVIRPSLLVEDFASIARPPESLAAGLREIPNLTLAIYDEEGLSLARELRLDRLPAFALVVEDGGSRKAFVAYGSGANLLELAR